MDPEVLKFRKERIRLIEEALSKQPPVTQEEAYAQYDRMMGITPRTVSADGEDELQADKTTEKEKAENT